MIYPLPAQQSFFRVTTVGRQWGDVLSGQGALFLGPTGNRYNVVLQQAAYVADSLRVAVTEAAYYAANDWQQRIGDHHVLPVRGPLVSDALLWEFTLQAPTYVVDVEARAALLSWPGHVLLNPCRNYAATQRLANLAVTQAYPGYPPPHPGLRVPAVRSRSAAGAVDVNFVLFRLGASPAGRRVGRWRLQVEFLDPAGHPVTAATAGVDWARPRFRVVPPRGRAPAGQTPPAGYAPDQWYPLHIHFV